MVTVYALGDSYWQELWSTRSGNSI